MNDSVVGRQARRLSNHQCLFHGSIHAVAVPQTLRVFVSSVIRGMESEREAVRKAIASMHLEPWTFETLPAYPESPRKVSLELAKECDLFVQLIGPSVSPIVVSEYHAATQDDPSKVLILAKVCSRDAEAEAHLKSVSPKHKYGEYKDTQDLPRLVQDSIAAWISRRAGRASRGVAATPTTPSRSDSPPDTPHAAKTGIGYWGSPRIQEYEGDLEAAQYKAVMEFNVENSRRKLAGEPPLSEDWLHNRLQTLEGEVHKRYPSWIETAAPTEEDRRIADRDRKVRALHAEGLSVWKIAKQLGIPRRAVRRILRPDEESFFGGGL